MEKENSIKIFQNKEISTVWNSEEKDWYFSVVDIVSVLTDSENPRKYWSVLKTRLKAEGSEVTTNCSQLKMMSADGKMRMRDALNTQGILRLIQSVPSPKAEPFKLWLAKVGSDRLDEIADPEQAIDRAVEIYRQKGYSEGWINQRLKSIEIRKGLTDEWNRTGVQKGLEYAILTDEITRAWSGMNTREYKEYKNLKKENLRDNMTNLELVLNMLAEVSTTEISKVNDPKGLHENIVIARQGGKVAGDARNTLEKELGRSVVTSLNASTALELSEGEQASEEEPK
jgi:hypothetical protein